MVRTPARPEQLLNVYIDESSQTNHRFFALGALVVNALDREALEQRIWKARLPDLPDAEMGWKKVSKAKLDAYRRVIDVMFDRRFVTQPMDYHMLVIDSTKLKDRVYNGGSRDVGFNKELCELAFKMARLYPSKLFHIYPDQRSTRTTQEELRNFMNFGVRKKGDGRDWPFRRVHFQDSKRSVPVQLADLLTGAIMFEMNRHGDAPDASPAKRALSAHVLSRSGVTDVYRDTAYSGMFTIWHRQLK